MAVKKFSVEASHIMMFARSIGDANPVYYDGEHAAGTEPGTIIAPPTFAQASAQFDPDYGLRPKIDGAGWFGSGGKAGGTESRQDEGGLHAEQRFVYHRHVKPGDMLSATTKPGDSWEKQGRRSGKLMFNEAITEYRDQNGELAITAVSVVVRTERPVDQRPSVADQTANGGQAGK